MNLRDATEIVNASVDRSLGQQMREAKFLPQRRTPQMILADIEASLALTHSLIRELRMRVGE